jgi:hypothetical protein
METAEKGGPATWSLSEKVREKEVNHGWHGWEKERDVTTNGHE